MRLLALGFVLNCAAFAAPKWVVHPTGTDASLRGICVVGPRVIWVSGNRGTILRSTDGGATWLRRPVPHTDTLDFRGLRAFAADRAVAMASGEGAQSGIYRTEDGGATWSIAQANPDEKGFFDAIAMTDVRHELVLGDPVDGMFALFRFGEINSRLHLPAALTGEGAFAASDSSLVTRDGHIWFGTGGPSGARVFRSDDSGEHWSVSKTPLSGTTKGSGIFSLAFADDLHGVAVGGDFEKTSDTTHNIALTSDGGVTWREPTGVRPRGYRSSVAWLPREKAWITTGPTGSEFSIDNGQTWTPFDDVAFHALGVGPGGGCWASGPNGRVAKLDWKR